MLETAHERLASYGDRVELVQSDLSVAGWSADLRSPYDAVVSAIAIHNLRDPAVIRSIYEEIASLIGPGGGFFNLDYCFMAAPAMSNLYAELMGRRSSSSSPASTKAEPASLVNQFRWLGEIGFDEVDCIWKEERRAMLCGLRH